jgi:predicted transcriptional regulator
MENERYAYMLVVDEKYWNRLTQQNKSTLGTHVFIRKSQVSPKTAKQLLFYVTGNKKMQVLGAADFMERLVGDSLDLWQKFGCESCFETLEEYLHFASGRDKMTFVRFNNFREIQKPKSKEDLKKIIGPLSRFGVGKYLSEQAAAQLA